jgi:UDP-N-acetylmuramate--alanine ligase
MPNEVTNLSSELRMESRSAGAGVDSLTQAAAVVAPARSRFTGRRVHFIGIGGCGMSGLARMLIDNGAVVTGSEPKPSTVTFELTKRGAKISRDQLGELLSREVDLVVRTAAIKDDNPEFKAAKAYGIKTIKYAEMLGEVMAERFGVAVAGTHGKSTTTAMIAHALLACGGDPSFVVGGTVPQLGGGSRSGASDFFVAEACEYDRSFHHLHPQVAIITNVEEDHLDCYKDLSEIIESFRHFAQLVPDDGLIIAGGKDPRVIKTLAGLTTRVELCAIGDGGFSWTAKTTGIENGCYRGEIQYKGQTVAMIRLSVAGEHNLINATMAVAACHACGIEPQKAADAIGTFLGVDRRMAEVGKVNGATVVDDYGHHPTEIRATLKALREKYQPRRLLCVFQPHQHSRTRFLLEDFATSFAQADETIVPDIYFVRDSESEKQRVSAQDLVSRITQNGQRARHLPQFSSIVEYLKEEIGQGDLVVTMGAGNVWEVGRDLVG